MRRIFRTKRRYPAADRRASACVLGDLDLIRPLGLAGVPCAAVTGIGSTTSRSRFISQVVPCADDEISLDGKGLEEKLLGFAASQPEPPVLFYQEDEHLLFVSRNRDRLAQGLRFIIADAALIEDLVDKARFCEVAQRLCLPVPPTQRVRALPGSRPPDVDVRFPVVIKPERRRKAWDDLGHAAKAVQIGSIHELREQWWRWSGHDMALLIQELIPGPETRIESYHVYVDQSGEVVGEFTGRKIRTLPPSHGYSTALTITDAADVAALGRSLVAKLGLRGVAKLDFKRDPEGKLYLLEVNPRFNLWHHLGAVAGVNLPKLVYNDLVGLPRSASPMTARAGVEWCRLSDDWRAAKASGTRLSAWLLWALRCEAKSFVWTDPMPFVQTARRALSRRLGAPHSFPTHAPSRLQP